MASSQYDLYLTDGRAHEKRGHYSNARMCYRWARDAARTIEEQERAKRLIEAVDARIGKKTMR